MFLSHRFTAVRFFCIVSKSVQKCVLILQILKLFKTNTIYCGNMQNFFGEILDFSPPFQIYKCYTLRRNTHVFEMEWKIGNSDEWRTKHESEKTGTCAAHVHLHDNDAAARGGVCR